MMSEASPAAVKYITFLSISFTVSMRFCLHQLAKIFLFWIYLFTIHCSRSPGSSLSILCKILFFHSCFFCLRARVHCTPIQIKFVWSLFNSRCMHFDYIKSYLSVPCWHFRIFGNFFKNLVVYIWAELARTAWSGHVDSLI